MGQTVSGENRKLLSPDQSHQSVNRRDTGPDIVSGIFPRNRVQGLAIYIQHFLRNNFTQSVNGNADSVHGAAQHILGNAQNHRMSGQAGVNIAQSQSLCAFKYLNDGLVLINLNDTAQLLFVSVYDHFHNFIVGGAGNAFQHYHGAVNCT